MQFKKTCWAIGVMLLLAGPALAQWTSVGTGIEYQKFDLSNPVNDVYVTRMLRAETNAYIESSIANGKMTPWQSETITNQVARNDDAVGYWGQVWGNRNDVIVGINGSYIDPDDGTSAGGVIHGGWYCKRYNNAGGSGFDWTLNRTCFIGGCVTHYTWKQLITYVSDGGVTQEFQGINKAPADGQITIFTPQYDTDTNTDNTVSEVLLEMARPALLIPTPSMAQGVVKQIRQNAGSTPMQFDQVVLSAKGSAATTLLSYATVGDTIGVSQEIKTYEDDCSTSMSVDWTKSYGTVSGNYTFLKGGVVQEITDPNLLVRDPRTAVGYSADYVFFFVVDGRNPYSAGMTAEEMGVFFRDTLGATDATNLDGGGSSCMVVNGVVMNDPSDGAQRPVVNGMLMCNLAAKAVSTRFATGNLVATTGSASCRRGPGTDWDSIATIPGATQGTIVEHALKGVYGKGYYWWKVDFSGTVGWVQESSLTLVSGGSPPAITQQPTNQITTLGGNAAFSVQASGTAPLSYQWQKSQVNLTNGGPFSGVFTSTLSITGASLAEAGAYRCVVTNAYGTATSNEATLTVRSPDFDGDLDVDLVDFAHLQLCLGTVDVSLVPSCANADLNNDLAVNSTDVHKFKNCMSGPCVPMTPACLSLP